MKYLAILFAFIFSACNFLTMNFNPIDVGDNFSLNLKREKKYKLLNDFFISLEWAKYYDKPLGKDYRSKVLFKDINREMTKLKIAFFDFLDIIEPYIEKVVKGMEKGSLRDSGPLFNYFMREYRSDSLLLEREKSLAKYVNEANGLILKVSQSITQTTERDYSVTLYTGHIRKFFGALKSQFAKNIDNVFITSSYQVTRESGEKAKLATLEIFEHVEKTYLREYIEVE